MFRQHAYHPPRHPSKSYEVQQQFSKMAGAFAIFHLFTTSRSLTIPGGKSGGRLCSRSGRYTPQSVRPRFVRDCVRQRQSYEKRSSRSRKGDFRTVFRGNPRQPIGAFASANATANANHDKRVMSEAILLVHAGLFVVCSAVSTIGEWREGEGGPTLWGKRRGLEGGG